MQFNMLNVVNVVMRSAVRAYSAHVSVAMPTSDVTRHANPRRMRNAPPPHTQPHVSATQLEHLAAGCVCFLHFPIFFSVTGVVSLWPWGRHPPQILSRLLSRSPQVSFILLCVFLSTSKVPLPSAYPRLWALSTVKVAPTGGYLHLSAGISQHSYQPTG